MTWVSVSQQLAELSVRAKSVEDAFAAAQKEAYEKLEGRKNEARAASPFLHSAVQGAP